MENEIILTSEETETAAETVTLGLSSSVNVMLKPFEEYTLTELLLLVLVVLSLIQIILGSLGRGKF